MTDTRTVNIKGLEVLSTKDWRADQSLHVETIARLGDGTRLRARVRRNAYNAQSFAAVDAWTTEAGWAPITSTPIDDTRIVRFSYVDRSSDWVAPAIADAADLLAEAVRFFAAG